MNYLSVCSGIEAATVAWEPLSWRAVAYSEIEKFPSAVLNHHYPKTPNWGDMTKYKDWPDAEINTLVGGTPCQSFSIAGLRKGLADPRGNLALVYLGIANRYRPDWVVWENVPGVLSSGDGRDFGAFLGALGKLGYGWVYRIFDAQYFGVPQRRRRVFVVGNLGDWRRAASVLFEPESLSRDSAPRRETQQEVTSSVAACLRAQSQSSHRADVETFTPVISQKVFGGGKCSGERDVAATLAAHDNRCDFEIENFVTASFPEVRRLTPTECERLQGFPDDYTNIKFGRPKFTDQICPDGHRYKALGNSMAVPVMRWIGEQINKVEKLK